MSIRLKILLIIVIAFAVIIGVFAIVSHVVLLSSFYRIENEYAAKNIQRVEAALESQNTVLLSTAGDWAAWDDTYRFVNDTNRGFVDDNLSIEGYTNLDVNCMLFFNGAGNLAFGRYADLLLGENRPVPAALLSQLQAHAAAFTVPAIAEGKAGIVILPDGPFVMAIRPILQNGNIGPPRGTLVIGRMLDSAHVASISTNTVIPIQLHRLDDPAVVKKYETILSKLSVAAPTFIKPLNRHLAHAYTVLPDIFNNPALLVEITLSRDISSRGLSAVNTTVGVMVGLMVFFGLLIVVLLHYFVIARLSKFTSRFQDIRRSADLSLRLNETSTDELGRFATVINTMLATLQQGQQQLKESEQKHRLLFDEMFDAFALHQIVCDEHGVPRDYRFVDVNPAFERTTRLTRSAVIGKLVSEVLPDVDPVLIQTYGAVATKGTSTHFEYFFKEHKRYYDISAFSPQPGFFATIFLDITDRKDAEQQQKDIQEQLQQAQKMQAIGLLAGGVAHDFNNMLGAISGFADLIKMKFAQDNPVLTKYVDTIIRSAGRMSHLAQELLAFARKGKYQVCAVDVHSIIADVNSLLEHTLDRRITVVQQFTQKECVVSGDGSQLHNVFLNLAVNARDAMPDGGTLTFATSLEEIDELFKTRTVTQITPGTYVRIMVSDSGVGMNDEVKTHIFEPFFTTKGVGRGTGLGLASVLGTIENHNGYIEVDSEVGEGTRFIIYLPALDSVPRPVQPLPVAASILKAPVSGTILIIDDEEMIQMFAEEALSMVGYSVQIADNGLVALEWFKDHHTEVRAVLLDIIMPTMGGYECFLGLKKIDPAVRVIVASGYALDKEARRILQAGALEFMQKPFSASHLIARVNTVVM